MIFARPHAQRTPVKSCACADKHSEPRRRHPSLKFRKDTLAEIREREKRSGECAPQAGAIGLVVVEIKWNQPMCRKRGKKKSKV